MVYPILIFTLPLLLGFLLDRALGDPMRLGHPIVFFGRLIGLGEKHLNHWDVTPTRRASSTTGA